MSSKFVELLNKLVYKVCNYEKVSKTSKIDLETTGITTPCLTTSQISTVLREDQTYSYHNPKNLIHATETNDILHCIHFLSMMMYGEIQGFYQSMIQRENEIRFHFNKSEYNYDLCARILKKKIPLLIKLGRITAEEKDELEKFWEANNDFITDMIIRYLSEKYQNVVASFREVVSKICIKENPTPILMMGNHGISSYGFINKDRVPKTTTFPTYS